VCSFDLVFDSDLDWDLGVDGDFDSIGDLSGCM
jgi:hypothetical protein